MRETTRPVGATLTWEQYCSRVGVDPHAARRATVAQALWAMLGGSSEPSPLPYIDATCATFDGTARMVSTTRRTDSEPSEPTPDDTTGNGQPF